MTIPQCQSVAEFLGLRVCSSCSLLVQIAHCHEETLSKMVICTEPGCDCCLYPPSQYCPHLVVGVLAEGHDLAPHLAGHLSMALQVDMHSRQE